MSAETHDRAKEQSLEGFLLAFLKQHDGLCLDNEQERETLATLLATALTAPENALQITDSYASKSSAE